ncbi:MAG TPA: helix-turn-helix domain-containing protein [Cellvibrionaceae bacterium]|nr:helix-turn-helix domain-containing protein [Cellvibrionaceae bacterium]
MNKSELSIGRLSKLGNCSIPTIRYYEQTGLLPEAGRSPSGHRYYQTKDLQRLAFVRRCRDLDFPIEQIKRLMPLLDEKDRQCNELRDLAQDQLLRVRHKLADLIQLEQTLSEFVSSCETDCIGGASQDCTIIESLSKPDMSLSTGNAEAQHSCSGTSVGYFP